MLFPFLQHLTQLSFRETVNYKPEYSELLHIYTHLQPQQGNPWPIPSQPANTRSQKWKAAIATGGEARSPPRVCRLLEWPGRTLGHKPAARGFVHPPGSRYTCPAGGQGLTRGPRRLVLSCSRETSPTGRGRARLCGRVRGARRQRGARSGESRGSGVSTGRGRGRGGGALTTGRTREWCFRSEWRRRGASWSRPARPEKGWWRRATTASRPAATDPRTAPQGPASATPRRPPPCARTGPRARGGRVGCSPEPWGRSTETSWGTTCACSPGPRAPPCCAPAAGLAPRRRRLVRGVLGGDRRGGGGEGGGRKRRREERCALPPSAPRGQGTGGGGGGGESTPPQRPRPPLSQLGWP